MPCQSVERVKMNLKTLPTSEIKKLAGDLQSELSLRDREADLQLAQCAIATGHPYLEAIAQAMLHTKYNVEPDIPDLGYFLAEHEADSQPSHVHVLFYKLMRLFDISEYVFAYTHYDEYMGGYLRRS